jgi:phosphohistidine phosphatase
MTTYRLILMRHATQTGSGDGSDHARTLTAVGCEEAVSVGLRLHALGFEPDRVLSSTATRCRQTWERLQPGLGTSPAIDFEDTLYNATADQLLHAVAHEEPSGTLLVLAHNPGVSMFSLALVRGHPESEEALRGGFAPASFAVFEIDSEGDEPSGRNARLLHFERPTRCGCV